jgi:hypothetical protein
MYIYGALVLGLAEFPIHRLHYFLPLSGLLGAFAMLVAPTTDAVALANCILIPASSRGVLPNVDISRGGVSDAGQADAKWDGTPLHHPT